MALFHTPLMASLGASAPQVSGTASFSVVENTSTSTVLATYSASGGLPVTWSLSGTDASNFTLGTTGQLRFSSSPDYETAADRSQSINVVATNAIGSDTLPVTITVTNDTSDDLPVITSGPSSITKVEGTSTSTTLGTYSASGPTPITWSTTGSDRLDFTIDSSGRLRFAATPDFESPADSDGNNVYSFNVRATNSNGYDQQAVTVTVTNDPSDDVFEATVTAHGSSTVYDLTSSGDSFTLVSNSGGSATTAPYSSSSSPKLYTMTVNSDVTVDVDVQGGKGGGGSGNNGGRITGRMTLSAGTTYRLIVGARGANGTSSQYGPGGYGGGGSGGGNGSDNGSSFGDGGVAGSGNNSFSSGDVGDGGGGLSGIFDGSPSQSTAIVIAGGGGGNGVVGSGGDGGGGTGSNLNGTAGANHVYANGGAGGTTTAGGAGGSGAVAGSNGGAGFGGGGGWNSYLEPGGLLSDTDYEGGGGGGGGYYGGGGGGAHARQSDGGAGGGGSGYYSSDLSNVGGARGYNTGEGRITITRV